MNRVRLIPMQFKNLRTGVVEDGYMIYDDYVEISDYFNEEKVSDCDDEFLRQVIRCGEGNEVFDDLITTACERGIHIANNYLTPEQVTTIFDEVERAKRWVEEVEDGDPA